MSKVLTLTGHTLRFSGRWGRRLIVTAILLLALGLLGLRVLGPVLIDWRAQAQQVLSESLQLPVTVQNMELDWWGWGPELRIQNLAIHSRDTRQRLFGFQKAQARVDLSRSLWQARVVLSELRLQGGEAVVEWPTWLNSAGGPAFSQDGQVQIDLHGLRHWLQGLERVAIHLDRIWLRSPPGNPRVDKLELGRDFSLSLQSVSSGSRQLLAALKLNPALGERIDLTANITPDAGHFYLRGERLKLAAWPNLKAGRGTIELWGDWRGQELDELQLQANFEGLRWASAVKTESPPPLPNLRLSAQGRRQSNTWSWQAHLQDTSSPVSPAAELYAEFEQPPDKPWRGRLNPFDLAAVKPWLMGLGLDYALWLERLQPEGTINQLEFQWDAERNDLVLSAAIDNFRSQAWGRIPGVQGLHGKMQLAGRNGRLELSGDEVQLNWPWLRETVQMSLQGPVRWRKQDADWAIDTTDFRLSNSDLKARINGGLTLTPAGPWFDLQLAYEQVDIARIPAYLPAAIMKPKLVAWLDHALTAGVVLQGTTVLRGWAKDFPFDKPENLGQGLFETQFQVADMRFDYFPGWTGIDDLSAHVTFRNRGFSAQADGGSLGGAELRAVSARIDDLKKAELHINSELFGATADMLNVLAQSPLREKVWQRLAGLQASGDNRLSLKLLIPIKKKKNKKIKVQVAGAVDFAGGTVQIPKHNLRFDDLHGVLQFSESTVSAQSLQLRFLEAPATLAITPQNKRLDFRLRGRFDTAALVQPYSESLNAYLRGASDWDIVLRMPAKPELKQRFELSLRSTLNGTEVLLPSPFGKQAEQTRPVQLELTQNQDRLVLQMQAKPVQAKPVQAEPVQAEPVQAEPVQAEPVQAEPDLSAALALVQTAQAWTVQRAELRLNRGTAELPERSERVLFAQLPSYTLNMGAGMSGAGLALFDRSELLISHLHIGGWRATDVRLQGRKAVDGYKFNLGGTDVAGQVFLPHQFSAAEPVYLKLDKLKLRSANAPKPVQAAAPSIDPRVVPPLHLAIERLYLDERFLGRLNTVLEPVSTGLALHKFELGSEQQRISATGEWSWRGAQPWSQLQAKLYSEALGETLALWNIPLQLERAKTALGLDLSWPGALTKPDVARLSGELQIHIEEGLLSGVKPGLGRMVGLFNIASLARRLAFDFSDLVETGLAFDQINGTIRFAAGQASTDDLLLEGPAVNIAIQGSLGLRNQQLQQTVVIMPQIASSLALAGAVAGGPAVGAAVLLAGQVLKPGLEQAVSFRYSVSGTLTEPVIQRVSAPPEADEQLGSGGRK